MTIGTYTNKTIFQRPGVFSVRHVQGYFQTEIVWKMDVGLELSDWIHYHNTSVQTANTRAGEVSDAVRFPGPPMTPVGRRLGGANSAVGKNGKKSRLDYIVHIGCSLSECAQPRELFKIPNKLPDAMHLVLSKRGVLKGVRKYPTSR